MENLALPKIALIAPGCKGDYIGSTIAQDKARLEELGFRVAVNDDVVSDKFPFIGCEISNTAEQRARQIINHAQDPEVVAIWAVNGGESAPEVAKLLVEYGRNPAEYIAKHEFDPLSGERLEYVEGAEKGFPQDRDLPRVVGMSDVSNIQIALAQFGFPALYGNCSMMSAELLIKASAAIKDENLPTEFSGVRLVGEGVDLEAVSGPVYATVGGGLYSSLRTAWQPKFLPNTVLMVEDVSGTEDLLKKLREAQNCGALENVQAIMIGNTSSQRGMGDDDYKAIADFSKTCGLPVFVVSDNQFGHLEGVEPKPITNFGEVNIDVRSGAAVVDPTGFCARAREFSARAAASDEVVKVEAVSSAEFVDMTGRVAAVMQLKPLNRVAERSEDLTELPNVVGGNIKLLPAQLDAKDKTLVVAASSWVGVGRELTDRYNKGDLAEVGAIIVATENKFPEAKARLDKAQLEGDESKIVAAGLSFLTYPAFEFNVAEDGRYVCNAPFLGQEDGALKTWAIGNVGRWLASCGVDLAPEDVEARGSSFSIKIAAEKNSEIIAKATSAEREGRVRQCEKRAEYFAKRYMEFSDAAAKTNQAGDLIAREVPVFMADIEKLPPEMRRGLFCADSLAVSVVGDKTFAAMVGGSRRRSSFVDAVEEKINEGVEIGGKG